MTAESNARSGVKGAPASIEEEALQRQLASQSLEDGGNLSNWLDVFAPEATAKEKTRATVQLFALQEKEAGQNSDNAKGFVLSDRLRPSLNKALADRDNVRDYWAATRFLSTLCAVAPKVAHALLFARGDTGLLGRVLERWHDAPSKDGDDDAQASSMPSQDVTKAMLALAAAELMCAAASDQDSRKELLASTTPQVSAESKGAAKIVELQDSGQGKECRPLTWLASFIERAEVENAAASTLLGKTALLAALALHKITRISPQGDDALHASATNNKSEDDAKKQQEALRTKEENQFLFEMCRRSITQSVGDVAMRDELATVAGHASVAFHESTIEDLHRLCHLSAVEGLTYLSVQSSFRDALSDDKELLAGLNVIAKTASGGKDMKSRYTFPLQVSVLAESATVRGEQAPDTALQFAVATLLATVMEYPPALSREQQQMQKLKRMANANATSNEDDPRLQISAVEERVSKLISARCIEGLVAMALSGMVSKGTNNAVIVNPSAGVRRAVSVSFLYATTKQDKLQRGVIIQQGGAKALVVLANYHLGLVLQGKTAPSDDNGRSFASTQALAHLLITENPNMVLSGPSDAIPPLAFLYMHKDVTRLQQFEAALALTNIASLDATLAQRIAQFSVLSAAVHMERADDFVGADRQDTEGSVSFAETLHERILHEEHDMSRRASLELLCNLLTCDEIFRHWSGDDEDGQTGAQTDAKLRKRGRAARQLVILALLCAPGGNHEGKDTGGKETAHKSRMAAGGALAMLCSSASTCSRMLEAEPRVLHRLCTLLDPRVRMQQERITEIDDNDSGVQNTEVDEDENAARDAEDCASDTANGATYARWQLALRGLAAVESIVQYVQWAEQNIQQAHTVSEYKAKFIKAGAVDAVQVLARNGTAILKGSGGQDASTRDVALVADATKQALQVLRTCQSIGLMHANAGR